MWVYNDDYKRWENTTDKLTLSDYELLKQELSSVRFYSKCLSGATYIPVHNLNDIYDILGKYKPRNWYLSTNATQYSNTGIPAQFATPITATTSYDYYTKYLTEYGLTLKNLFTPNRLIKDSINNYVTVDLATTEQLVDLTVRNTNRIIDGVKVINGHRVLVKDQTDLVTLANTENPDDYFLSPYTVVQNFGATIAYETASLANGIYVYRDGDLIREPDLEEYENCKRYSVVVKSGATNFDKQFHLVRLLNGYFPTTSKSEPIQFIESKNWILRHRVDYNNLFEINYYDVVKYPTQSYHIDGITYSIPERTIAVGEFGIINNTQEGVSNIIYNKYKVNLRSITQTKRFYFICGDDGILLKVRKHDFQIQRLILPTTNNLRSVSFFDDLKGVVVGDLNTVYVTENEGISWTRLRIGAFDPYYFTKVIYHSPNGFYTSGNVGVFVEFKRDIYGWTAFKRRISRFIDDDDEYLLVDNINDIHYTTTTTWGLSYSYLTQSIPVDKAMMFIVTDDSKIIIHDINGFTNFNFIYLDFPNKYGDIRNITRKFQSNEFYFTGIDESTGNEGLYSFSLDNFQYIGVGNSYSNTISATISAVWESEIYGNEIFDYFAQDLIVAGNESLYKSSTYSTSFNFQVLDSNFESRLKSKLLFIDYDAGSKLNFFTDFGDYRLPQSAILPTSLSNLSFSPLVYGPTAPSFMTQSEVNWFKYWQDGRMTFEYYTINPTTDTTKVLISPSFSYSSVQSELSISSVTYDINDIINLAPTISDVGHSRFYAIGLTAISAPTASYDLYLYDYLMILKTSTSYAVSNGDVMRLSSDVVTDNFIVNKIVDFGPDRYIYMFSEFNQNIITALSSSTNITITNLNSFLTTDELLERFNIHPISNGYELSYTEQNVVNQLLMDFSNGGSTSSYTNWIFSGGFTTSANFPTSPVISAPYTSSPYSYLTTGVGDNFIETPEVYGIENISFSYRSTTGNYSPSLTFSSITVQGLSGSNWIDINTSVILDGFAGFFPVTASFSVAGEYSKFRFNLRTSSTSPSFLAPLNYKPVRIDDLKLMGDDGLYIDEESYGTSREDIDRLKVDAKFNNLTAYYNLATNVFVDSLTYSMIYTDGFLKFGYTPTYNLIDYLESINEAGDPNPKFYATKEYYAMPDLRDIPMPGINSFTFSTAYIDYNGMTAAIGLTVSNRQDNKILFGTELKTEWDSIFINTFVDINLYATSSVTTTERALVTKKYSIFDEINGVDYYVVEFHKRLNYVVNSPLYKLDIISRRKLIQISEDLQQLNLVQRPTKSKEYLAGANSNIWTADFTSYQREMNFKVNTDSYAKILLSDDDTIQSISAILYTDFKNELAMNITRLGKEVTVPILNTANFAGNLFISCSEKHGLKDEEGVVLEFFGGTGSSQTINQQYFGYHPIKKVNEYNFYINFPYGNTPLVGNDIGYVKYTRQDPFLNYLPIDLIDVGVDKRGKIALELTAENTVQFGETYSLVNVDFSKYRFRLVDGLNIETLALNYPWIYEAEISGAVIGQADDDLIWYKGTWECGRWFGGTWQSGLWKSGDWYGGTWNSKLIDDNYINVQVDDNSNGPSYSTWINGRWYDGTWNNGIWSNGRWYGGTWSNGTWYKGIWNDGLWLNGNFNGGIWVLGTWRSGIFNTNNEPSYWIDGYWYGGDFENGMWYSGVFDQKFQESRFGTNAYNSRTATWHGGKWVNGSFHSRLNINDDGQYDVSDVHKYSIWYTGQWFRGDFYGGVAYNMDFKSGTWHGGILEDIQIIGLTGSTASSENYFTVNGIFKFNIGDEISIIDNQIGNTYSLYGSNQNPQDYTVLYTVEDSINKRTNVYVNRTITLNATSPMDVGIRVVSRFGNCNWKSGIWTNGLFNSGIWEGGIWYGGVFGNDATWM